MFGESESESPRVPSPWDSLVDADTPPPKLAPEAEEGNVEYKLQLLSPTPDRFARLTTQLKWRLLEGGGYALYELGVADSGDLVGLTQDDMSRTLDTLGCMARELGARVVVVREYDVGSDDPLCDDGFVGRRSTRKPRNGALDTYGEPDFVTPFSFPGASHSSDTSPAAVHLDADASPPSSADDSLPSSLDIGSWTLPVSSTKSLATSPVTELAQIPVTTTKSMKKIGSRLAHTHPHYHNGRVQSEKQSRSQYRRLARDRRRAEKEKADEDQLVRDLEGLRVGVPIPVRTVEDSPIDEMDGMHTSSSFSDVPSSLGDDYSIISTPSSAFDTPASSAGNSSASGSNFVVEGMAQLQRSVDSISTIAPSSRHDATVLGIVVTKTTDATKPVPATESTEPRVVIEALVIRKLALGDAFLDFSGFMLL
ncbi:hypothetical protein PLICRDRAFT_126321 [Plicaturopsis crispa FD-325 SS-3]|nr:hypothetical protein PLICRDRAFT_126321 [Plicaturopsis crispa FD-325 SS-3]